VSLPRLRFYTDCISCILEHIYAARPPSPKDLIARIRKHPSPNSPVLYLPDLVPITTAYCISHSNLRLICTSSKETPALAILEFLNRLVDILEDFLGSPLIRTKIEESYEIIAQILSEICDGGLISNTEPNALREQIEITSGLGKLFTQVGIPTTSITNTASTSLAATLKAASTTASGPAIPWRRPNVRHTSNELYVDMVESLSIIYAPSGHPISAHAQGSILFTSKISGVPDLLLTLSAPGGTSTSTSAGITRTMALPTFHPCVRLNHFKSHPGELSFIPPDGRFMLAGYETDLLPYDPNSASPPKQTSLFLPATIDLHTNLGRTQTDFSARLTLNTSFPGVPKSAPGRATSSSNPFSFGASSGSSSQPTLEGVLVTIPFPPTVRSVTELKPSRGEARFDALSKTVEWKVPTKDGASVSGTATLTGSVVGPHTHTTNEDEPNTRSLSEYYDYSALIGYDEDKTSTVSDANGATPAKKTNNLKTLMPRSASLSFTVKGWLASGIRVESLNVDIKRSRGLGEGVKPYKGVKYLSVSRRGVERRVG
jgi:AP-3 complex subunit mu